MSDFFTSPPGTITPTSPPQPRQVGAAHGWRWIVESFLIVRDQPLTWALFALAYFGLHLLVSSLPMIGGLLAFLLGPLFAGGFVLAAARAEHHDELGVADLFGGFRRAGQALFGVGLLYLALLLAALLGFGVLLRLLGGTVPTPEMMSAPGHVGTMMASMLLGGVIVFVVNLAYWFAPALVVQNGLAAWPALKLSIRAGLVNWPAVLTCGLMLTVLFVLAALPLFLGLLLWFPVVYVTGYTAWKDVFGQP
ncbi:BPSS1780 family membrane protein [Pseudogulbenkiania subflava]|uniref:Uncharacterized membrane protein n=1 Tax=Pseudogulbenkiania subflava DSM 22618 TaxID=1123014 RepID=A0A1Y6BX36_9NEIS|nr:BPSS1780 family membrane protein [Pseudogulbenkiania subflava]SMF29658.1 Uncharacterized membrane protein [Pseudogulbenkiania subflava DSM 22618]